MSVLPFLILQVVIFAGLVLVLRRVLSRSATDTAAHLQSLTAEYTRRQEELKKRLEESEHQYTEQVSKAKAEAERIVSEAKQETAAAQSRTLEEARTESERIVRQGVDARDALRRDMDREINSRALERACELIQAALPRTLREDLQQRWFEELFRNGGADHFKQLNGEGDVREVKVVSALPLTKEQQSVLKTQLKARLGRDVEVTEEIDERLVAGLTLTVGSVVLDGSLASKIHDAMRKANNAAN